MYQEDYILESEEEVPFLVFDWVNDNEIQFGTLCRPLYGNGLFKRCKRYLYSPDIFLKERLKSIENSEKWFLQIFQIIVLTGVLGSVLYLWKFFLDNISDYISRITYHECQLKMENNVLIQLLIYIGLLFIPTILLY